ncbi:MAG TPA: metallophosphoesterase family protein [Polyangiaceae bacterium]|nr:metallophosphoesterase family protein [Polyangiaceae bacterium]
MRIGLIGDVHQEDLALGWALAWLSDQEVDLCVCVGDIADGFGDLDACCELLDSHGVITVRGNHDRWFLAQQMRDVPQATPLQAASEENREWLRQLPATVSIDTPAGRALVCHGTADDDMLGVRPDDEGYALDANESLQRLIRAGEHRILIAGHTHLPMLRRVSELTVVNAGTLHRNYDPCVGLLDTTTLTERFVRIPAVPPSS